MKKILSGLILLGGIALSSLPASAQVQVKDMILKKSGKDGSIRVILANTDNNIRVENPGIKVTVYTRATDRDEWKVAQAWTNNLDVNGTREQTLDIMSQSNPALKAAIAGSATWQARVVVEGAHQSTVEKTASYSEAATR